jgi:hypothetical protein
MGTASGCPDRVSGGGYCLEYGGYATIEGVAKAVAKPDSDESKLVALVAKDPKKYRLSVICSRDLPTNVPPQTWTRDANGRFLDGKAQSLDGTEWHKGMRTVYSPASPDSVWKEAGRLRADAIREIRQRCPIAVILNGGEYGLNVLGFCRKAWEKDPAILKDKGDKSWPEYISQRKAHEEMLIADAVKAAAPDRLLYIYYTTSGAIHRNPSGNWGEWGPGYEWLKPVSDLASSEHYYEHFNTGWTGKNDMLTLALAAKGFEISQGQPLSYDWLCAGWPRDKGLGSTQPLTDGGLGDIALYTGFLKCLNTAGMVGGNAGYYAYPKGGFGAKFDPIDPPHWLRQMVAFAYVHALFSHLEPFLRQGDLLPGPGKHRDAKDQPAYEFSTGRDDVRVLARKLRDKPQWLVTAWAADGKEQDVKVIIPGLGELTLHARPCGSVYQVTRQGEKVELQLMDKDGMRP